MRFDLQIALASVGAGAAYGLLALALIVVHRGSKTLNLGTGALAALGAYVAAWVHADGDRLGAWPAAIVGTVAAALAAGLFGWLVMRRLRSAAMFVRVAATLGLLVVVQAAVNLFLVDGSTPQVRLFERGIFTLPGDYVLTRDRLFILVTATVVVFVVAAVYRYTPFGLVSRAMADGEAGVSLSGHSPDIASTSNWMLGGALSGFAGVLLSSITTVSVLGLTLLVVVALATAAIAGFRSVVGALVASLAVAAVQSVVSGRIADISEFTGLPGWPEAVPFIVLIVVIVATGTAVPTRGISFESGLPAAPPVQKPARLPAAVVAVGGAAMVLGPSAIIDPLTRSAILAIVAVSLVLVVGFVGQLSLAQMTFAGLGAAFGSWAAISLDLPFPLPVLVAIVLVFPVGLVLGAPSIRVRGVNLAIVTLGVAVVFDEMFFSDRDRFPGGIEFPRPSLAGWSLDSFEHPRRFGVVVVIALALACLVVQMIRSRPAGQSFLAVRINERGAEGVGISVPRVKLLAFSISASMAAAGGALLGYRSGRVSAASFVSLQSVFLLVVVVIGGVGAAGGGVVAGLLVSGGLLTYLASELGASPDVIDLASGLLVLFILTLMPDGLTSLPTRIKQRFEEWRDGGGADVGIAK